MTTLPYVGDGRCPVVPREGAPAVTLTSRNAETLTESYSLRTVPVLMKANGKKVKLNAILDDASKETFVKKEVAGGTGTARTFLESSSSCYQRYSGNLSVHPVND